nr:hypothetical protein JVH1_4799 [Rhodococcus sp. JVH1]
MGTSGRDFGEHSNPTIESSPTSEPLVRYVIGPDWTPVSPSIWIFWTRTRRPRVVGARSRTPRRHDRSRDEHHGRAQKPHREVEGGGVPGNGTGGRPAPHHRTHGPAGRNGPQP